jgi:hypothetical protein
MRHETDTHPEQHRLMSYIEHLQQQGTTERTISDVLYQDLTEQRTANPITRRWVAAFKTFRFGNRFSRC